MKTSDPIQLVLSKLTDAMPAGPNKWKARCPAHDDRNPSLSIAKGRDGCALVKCFGGCDTGAVLATLGLRLADLMVKPTVDPAPNGKAPNIYPTANAAIVQLEKSMGKRSAHWLYHNTHGEPIGAIVRWDSVDGKEIRPVSRNGKGWYIGGMPEPRPLYDLPAVLATTGRVFVTEGEKAADAVRGLGLTATTSPHGSKSADKADWTALAGREVVILPDNDEPGSAYAEQVAGILAALQPAARVRIVQLPDLPSKGDALEFIAAREMDGKDNESIRTEIESLANQAPVWKPEFATAAAKVSEDLDAGPEWPNPLAPEAFHGLAGEVVKFIEPYSEADPVALLVQLFTSFGNRIGRTANFRAEGHTHFLNLFTVLVGKTSKSRKGTSWGRIRQYVEQVDPDWMAKRVQGGLASGEGMVYAVRDEVKKSEPIKGKGGRVESYQEVIVDEGEPDKRLLCLEEEYAGVLRMLERQGNSLSQRIREAWQGQPLGSMTKHSPTKCKEPHLSIIGHVTAEEVRRYLTATEMGNGFGNRHLWFCVARSKLLPEGSWHEPDQALVQKLAEAGNFAAAVGELKRDEDARRIWHQVYGELSEGKPGLAGAILGRAEAQVMRLACLYAVLDLSAQIRAEHLQAALALWDYAEASVFYIFGDSTGDPVADDILRALRAAPAGRTRTDISSIFHGNQSSGRIGKALCVLLEHGLAKMQREETRGKPAERWTAVRNKRN